MPFTTRSNPLPLLCRKSYILSQQLRQESGHFLGISPKSPYLCISYLNHTLVVFFCIFVLGYWLVMQHTGFAETASPFAISSSIKNMGHPCQFSISSPCRLNGGWWLFVVQRYTFSISPLALRSMASSKGQGQDVPDKLIDSPFGASLEFSPSLSVMGILPYIFYERKGCDRLFCRD